MKLFILSHTLVLIKKIKGNKETSLVYFYYQSSNINCLKGNRYIVRLPTCNLHVRTWLAASFGFYWVSLCRSDSFFVFFHKVFIRSNIILHLLRVDIIRQVLLKSHN